MDFYDEDNTTDEIRAHLRDLREQYQILARVEDRLTRGERAEKERIRLEIRRLEKCLKA